VFGLLSKYTFLSGSEFGDLSTATFFKPNYNPTAIKKKKKVWNFFHHYLRPIPLDSSLLPYHIPSYHFYTNIFDPAHSLFSSPILMAHTRSQELESLFNTLQSGFLETQQEVQHISATIASRDASMNASINVAV
jgi:hypothetical protein